MPSICDFLLIFAAMNASLTSVGLDAKRIVANASGLGSYGRNLVNGLAAVTDSDFRFLLYTPCEGQEVLREQLTPSERWQWRVARCHTRLGRDYWRTRGVVRQLQQDGVRLFHGLSGELPMGLRQAGVVGVMTVHDLIFLRHPEWYKPWDAWLYRRKFFRSLRECERIIAISERTKEDVLYYTDFPAHRIDVIYQSCGTRFSQPVAAAALQRVAQRYGLPSRFVLSVGTIEARKNVALAVRALAALPQSVHMVLVGRATPYLREVQRAACSVGVAERLHVLQGVPNEDLPALYRLASLFVYPSRYEGFGLPIIEAIRSGLPVVAATGSCLEEAGGSSMLYVQPDDVAAMANAMQHMLGEDVTERVAAAQRHVQRFEQTDVAQQVLATYRQALSQEHL